MSFEVWGVIVYEQEGVFIHYSSENDEDHDALQSGLLRVIEKITHQNVIIDWRPLDDSLDSSNILYAKKVC
uniref:Uncharacterized protein n=1 Tax=Pseudonaja textilis TaxID=8673 RepID=A0A670YFD4_PSETE